MGTRGRQVAVEGLRPSNRDGWHGMGWGGLPHPGNMRCCTHFQQSPCSAVSNRQLCQTMHTHPRQIGAPRGPHKGCWGSDLHSLGLHLWLLVGVVCVCVCVCHSRRYCRQARASRFCQPSPEAVATTHRLASPPKPSDRLLRLSPRDHYHYHYHAVNARPDKASLPMTVQYRTT